MIKGLSEEEKYRVLRPIIEECEYDENMIPIIKKTKEDIINWDNLKVTGLQNISKKTYNKDTLLLMFSYDKKLLPLWNNPLKKVGLFQSYAAIGTPDFSIYSNMNINDIRYNIYMARWLGCTWQNYGCTVLPTVGWGLPDTYDLSFNNIEKESIVIISTLGCQENEEVFLDGFKEMKKRIRPPLIVVYGDMINGMTGRFINYKYSESFSTKHEQLRLKEVSKIFTIKEEI